MSIVLALFISACANHEGMYEPACIAYQGDKIELRDGRFTWQRYTDERTVDEAGNVVEPFPGFPKAGSYRVAADKLELVTEDNVRLDDWFIVEHAGKRYLLDAEQHKAFLDGGELPKCALAFTAADS
jgi:hypothetical protein